MMLLKVLLRQCRPGSAGFRARLVTAQRPSGAPRPRICWTSSFSLFLLSSSEVDAHSLPLLYFSRSRSSPETEVRSPPQSSPP